MEFKQVANRHVGIFDEALLEQANGAVEFLEFAFNDFVRNVRRLCLVPVPCKFRVPPLRDCPGRRRG